ncbi:hypothetical protein HHI36_009854 [Cryptolaemus montrouzieri]|uniref:Uncharacterized protein n=1 Tax=Cryptolaemus montrouzieri TaxID=559131 RepID=A0ABD2MH42_9CUCU
MLFKFKLMQNHQILIELLLQDVADNSVNSEAFLVCYDTELVKEEPGFVVDKKEFTILHVTLYYLDSSKPMLRNNLRISSKYVLLLERLFGKMKDIVKIQQQAQLW